MLLFFLKPILSIKKKNKLPIKTLNPLKIISESCGLRGKGKINWQTSIKVPTHKPNKKAKRHLYFVFDIRLKQYPSGNNIEMLIKKSWKSKFQNLKLKDLLKNPALKLKLICVEVFDISILKKTPTNKMRQKTIEYKILQIFLTFAFFINKIKINGMIK